MTPREGAILKLLSGCLQKGQISGVDPRVPFPGKWERGKDPDAPEAPKNLIHRRQAALRACECGTCPRCMENARWERIYQEKFADPDYYSRLVVRGGSPFDDF